MLKIENAPLPEKETPSGQVHGPNMKYPFLFLEVGQSFFVKSSKTKTVSYMRSIGKWREMRGKMKYSYAMLDDGRIQIWRIS